MPTYRFRDKDTEQEFDKFMSIAAREDFLKSNPNYEQIMQSTMLGDSVRVGVRTVDADSEKCYLASIQPTQGAISKTNYLDHDRTTNHRG